MFHHEQNEQSSVNKIIQNADNIWQCFQATLIENQQLTVAFLPQKCQKCEQGLRFSAQWCYFMDLNI